MENDKSYHGVHDYLREDIIKKLRSEGYLPQVLYCEKCNIILRERFKSGKTGLSFYCPKCKTTASVRKGSYFEHFKTPLHEVILTIFLWAAKCTVLSAVQIVGLDQKTLIQHYQRIRELCAWKLAESPDLFFFGGDNGVVQIDTKIITKTKKRKGAHEQGKWIFCIYDTVRKLGYVEFVPDCSAATLLPIIERHILPGTIIYSSEVAAYQELSTLNQVSPYIHQSVNLSQNFKDPITGSCTSAVMGYWATIKTHLRKQGIKRDDMMPSHLEEIMWRERFVTKKETAFKTILRHIRERYTW